MCERVDGVSSLLPWSGEGRGLLVLDRRGLLGYSGGLEGVYRTI